MEYQHLKGVFLMIWETSPKKRNVNNQIKFNILNHEKPKEGDIINCGQSTYKLTEIEEIRESSTKGFIYVTAKTQWFNSY